MEKTTIAINKSTREALRLLGKKDEDYDEIVRKCIDFTKKFENEYQFHEWFKKNFDMFGFDKIKEERLGSAGYPDFIMIKSGKEVRVELETASSHFIQHKHDPKGADLVICLVNDKEIPVKTLEITPFESTALDRTTIQISIKTRSRLKMLAAIRDTTYNDILDEITKNEILRLKLDKALKHLM